VGAAAGGGGQDNAELVGAVRMLIGETKKTNALIKEWPKILQVNNNVRDTMRVIKQINTIDKDSRVGRG